MAGITLDQAQAKLATWMAADDAVSAGQSYEIHGRKLSRANASEIAANIEKWNQWCIRLDRGGCRVRNAVPM